MNLAGGAAVRCSLRGCYRQRAFQNLSRVLTLDADVVFSKNASMHRRATLTQRAEGNFSGILTFHSKLNRVETHACGLCCNRLLTYIDPSTYYQIECISSVPHTDAGRDTCGRVQAPPQGAKRQMTAWQPQHVHPLRRLKQCCLSTAYCGAYIHIRCNKPPCINEGSWHCGSGMVQKSNLKVWT